MGAYSHNSNTKNTNFHYNGINRGKLNLSGHDCLYVVGEKDLIELAKNNNLDYVGVARTASGYAAPSLDVNTLRKVIRDLGFTGRAYTKLVNGKKYIIFKGRPGLRKIFTGTRYLSNNAKVVDMIIGKQGVIKSAIQGARLTIFLTVPLIVLQHVLKDRFLMEELLADLGVSLIKVGISSIVGAVFAVGAGAVTTIVSLPIAVAIVVGVATSYALDKLDAKYGITDRLTKLLEEKATIQAKKTAWEIEDNLRWKIANSQNIGKGVFY